MVTEIKDAETLVLENAALLVSVFTSETEYAQGSGFFIHQSGIGGCNYHVFGLLAVHM